MIIRGLNNLHSNMVLFKLQLVASSQVITLFTFQYGSIQIANLRQKIARGTHLHSNMVLFKSKRILLPGRYTAFTFQYGSIQIISITPSKFDVFIYIPIWFYSNSDPSVTTEVDYTNLHSNMVLFK